MKIEFLFEEKTLLSAKYIKLITKEDFVRIVVKKEDIKSVNFQFGNILDKDLDVTISFKSFKSNYIFNISDILFKTNEIILIGVLVDSLYLYDQGYIDNFKLLTDNKEKINWYELNKKQKYYYLRGCYFLGGLKKTIENRKPIITVDLSKVKTDLDVYYELGKAFFKSYGYFGTELDSFVDCLINISTSIKDEKTIFILKIKGYENFKKNFSDNILSEIFYEKFTNIGFKIEN
ncbi:barstar family protein [Chryseobacterium sp. JJR-5R]|uniref:barstar family protein n=1 Tax=Chryseobacterium sp. JJR-5R TaxID=3093923 RepID=UPI002A762648|nr:barstar family protein [Chryseobacterium sp. JJR-5R]WPO84296.1 barstar family protein [Chryseobacterium sp. JJR-5R]